MLEIRLPCRICGAKVPDNEYYTYGGEICEHCTAERYTKYKCPGCFSIRDNLKAPNRRGAIPGEIDDMDSKAWEEVIDSKPVTKPKTRRQQFSRCVAANNQ